HQATPVAFACVAAGFSPTGQGALHDGTSHPTAPGAPGAAGTQGTGHRRPATPPGSRRVPLAHRGQGGCTILPGGKRADPAFALDMPPDA
ncbi:MAG: hypothetical protein ACUVS4_00385, partial [Chloroflexaceae bacterium]